MLFVWLSCVVSLSLITVSAYMQVGEYVAQRYRMTRIGGPADDLHDPCIDCDESMYEILKKCWDRTAKGRPGFKDVLSDLDGLVLRETPLDHAKQWRRVLNGLSGESQTEDLPYYEYQYRVERDSLATADTADSDVPRDALQVEPSLVPVPMPSRLNNIKGRDIYDKDKNQVGTFQNYICDPSGSEGPTTFVCTTAVRDQHEQICRMDEHYVYAYLGCSFEKTFEELERTGHLPRSAAPGSTKPNRKGPMEFKYEYVKHICMRSRTVSEAEILHRQSHTAFVYLIV